MMERPKKCGECRFFDRTCRNPKFRGIVRKMLTSADREACVYGELQPRTKKSCAECAKLRKFLREAVVEFCYACDGCAHHSDDYPCERERGACFVQKWREAVGMNGGRE